MSDVQMIERQIEGVDDKAFAELAAGLPITKAADGIGKLKRFAFGEI